MMDEFEKELEKEEPIKQGFTVIDFDSLLKDIAEDNSETVNVENTENLENTDNVENTADFEDIQSGSEFTENEPNEVIEQFQNGYVEEETETSPMQNPVEIDAVTPPDCKSMSKGLKVFSLIMAAIIAITSGCVIGYFTGISSMKEEVTVDLKARPKNTDQYSELQVYELVNPSVVGIIAYSPYVDYTTSNETPTQSSGIVYSESGYIVTNDHIYASVPSAKFKIYDYNGNEYDATYVAGDVVSDLAVLKVEGANLKPAEFGNSDEALPGEDVVAIGRPDGATKSSSITRGLVSAVNRRVQVTSSYSSRLIQTDSAINQGNSGGALVNMYGQVIGVVSSKLVGEDIDGVGYAIPTTVMKRIVDELIKENKVVSRAKLGISYNMIDSITAELLGYKNVGLLLGEIDEESSLYGKAEKGEVITHISGYEITDDDIVLDIIERSYAGDKISLTIVSAEGNSRTVEVELKANVSQSSYIEEVEVVKPSDTEQNILEKDPNIHKDNSSSHKDNNSSQNGNNSSQKESGSSQENEGLGQ